MDRFTGNILARQEVTKIGTSPIVLPVTASESSLKTFGARLMQARS